MEPVVTTRDGRGKANRDRRRSAARPTRRAVPAGLPWLALLLFTSAHLAIWSLGTRGSTESPPFGKAVVVAFSPPDLPPAARPIAAEAVENVKPFNLAPLLAELSRSEVASRLSALLRKMTEPDEPAATPLTPPVIAPILTPPDFGAPSSEALMARCAVAGERRFLIREEDGRQVVARLHGRHDEKTVLMLPDGRLGIPSMLVPTDEPFRPMTADEVAEGLRTGPFADFAIHRTPHYLILHQATDEFVKTNGELLEELYSRLLEAFRGRDVAVHEAEFPLVAVIFRSERDFRAHRAVAPDVQAYYEIFSNRIFFYQTSDREGLEPEVGALLKPQVVAHEGTHQVLQNIGVQPRLAAWPLWLVEGLAEYCATPAPSRKGPPTWDGLGQINNLHMATLREIEDPLSLSMQGPATRAETLFRHPGQPLVEAMLRRTELTPTEYALAWAMTHYLALKRGDDFVHFLKRMAEIPPLAPRTADDQVADFRAFFGDDLVKLDKAIDAYLRKLTRQKGYAPMPYYAVMFEQPLTPGLVRRAAMVSQSPQVIRQWVRELSNPTAGPTAWQALPHPSRARANLAIQQWMRNH